MSQTDCYVKVKQFVKESGLEIPDQRLKEFAHTLSQKRAELLTKGAFASEVEKLVADDLERFAAKRRAADAIAIATRENAVQTILNKPYGTTVVENFKAYLAGGSIKAGDSVNLDPARIAASIKSDLLGFWRQGIEKFRDVAAHGALNKEIYQEVDALQRGLPTGQSGSKVAAEIAQVVHATQNRIFDLKKSYNPFMEKNGEYLIKRFHNREKVSAVTQEEWIADAMRSFGEKSFPDLSPEEKIEVFASIYERIKDGSYGSLMDTSSSDKFITVRGDGGNIMRRMAKARSLVAKDWQAAFDYNQKYGFDTIEATVMKVIDGASRDVALLEKFGPNPEGMYEGLYRRVSVKASAEEKADLKAAKPELDRLFQAAAGHQGAPARGQWAKWTQGALTLQYMAKTGSAVLRSLPDIAVASGLIRGLNGKTVFQNAAELVSEYVKGMSSSSARNQALEGLWMFSKSTVHNLMSDFSGAEVAPGKLGKAAELFGSLNLLERHVDSMRSAVGTVVSKELARAAESEHVRLPETWKKGLLRYGIGEDEWNVLRQGVQDWGALKEGATPGKLRFLNADGVDAIPDEVISNFLKKSGATPGEITPETLFLTRKKLSYKLGALVNDHADYGSTTPGTRQKAFMFRGLDINDPIGMTLRLAWQFKSATLTSFDAFRRIYFSGEGPKGDWSGITQTMALSMFFWSIGEYAKQAFEGKTPEDPANPGFIGRAVVGSGAGGMFADILLGEADRQGVLGVKGGILANLAGPTAGTLAEGVGIATQYAKSAFSEEKAPHGALSRFILNQIPGQNLFYTRGAFNFYFANGLREFLDSGYLGHLERTADQTPGLLEPSQRYFTFKPSEAPVWPSTIAQ